MSIMTVGEHVYSAENKVIIAIPFYLFIGDVSSSFDVKWQKKKSTNEKLHVKKCVTTYYPFVLHLKPLLFLVISQILILFADDYLSAVLFFHSY